MKNLIKVASYWKVRLDDNYCLSPGEEVYFPGLLSIATKSKKILEVGVGKGRMVNILRDNGVDAEFYGVDITDNAKRSGSIAVMGDARKLPFRDNTFDLVYSLGVIEHFPETPRAVEEHARVAKKGGHVLITTPHLSVFTPLRYVGYQIFHRKYGSFEEIEGRNIRLPVMKRYFTDSNLDIRNFGVYGTYVIWRLLRRIKLDVLQRKIQEMTPIGAFLYVTGMKKD